MTARDRVLSPHIPVLLMRYVPETKVILVIPIESEVIYVFHSKNFALRSMMDPRHLVINGTTLSVDEAEVELHRAQSKRVKSYIYDCVYMVGKDTYCFSSDDYSLYVIKEIVVLGGQRVTYNQIHHILHTLNHPMLCWSPSSMILCSVSTSNILFGWDLENGAPVYQSIRHSEVITNIIAIKTLDVFATCSMDKSILFQAASTGRVKGVMKGHHRGIKCLDATPDFLIRLSTFTYYTYLITHFACMQWWL